MDYNEKIKYKIYILITTIDIEKTVDLMIQINGIYHHDFFENYYKHKNYKLCFICWKQKYLQFNNTKETPIPNDENEINIINNDIMINNTLSQEFKVCFDKLDKEEKMFIFLQCGHIYCK